MIQETLRIDMINICNTNQQVNTIEVKKIVMPAGAKAAYHSHPCHVIGYIVSGTVLFQIEGNVAIFIESGNAFHEPKDAKIRHFDNASESDDLVFIAFYLKEDNEALIEMLDTHK